MAISALVNDIHQLQHPSSPAHQVALLKHLKNELIGHPERKEEAVRQGVVDVLISTLSNLNKTRGKKRTLDVNGTSNGAPKPSHWSEEAEVQLQAVTLVGSLAHGGPAFVSTLLSTPIVCLLLDTLRIDQQNSRLRLATLKALAGLVQSTRLLRIRDHPFVGPGLVEVLFSRSSIQSYASILSQKSSSSVVQQQISLIAQYLAAVCNSDLHRSALLAGGILDLLASRLTAYFIHQRFWSPGSDPALLLALPPPPSSQTLANVLAAIVAILGTSKYRVAQFLYSPLVISFFPFQQSDVLRTSPLQFDKPISYASEHHANPLDSSLPRIPAAPSRIDGSFPKVFPALSSIQPTGKGNAFIEMAESSQHGAERLNSELESESSMVAWLIYLVRNEQGVTRLVAAELLALVSQAGFISKNRERMLALLIVPLLTKMIEDNVISNPSDPSSCLESSNEAVLVQEKCPVILASLIEDSSVLQKAALDAGIVPKVCTLLKRTFGPQTPRKTPWLPYGNDALSLDRSQTSRRLGSTGLPGQFFHALCCREAALVLIAAVTDKDDQYKKMVTDQGIISFILDSLLPYNEQILAELVAGSSAEEIKASDLGNPLSILVAACNAVRALSRSPSILRTGLIDAGIAKPIVSLLTHSHVSIMIAATDVVCNLLVEYSPMRQELIQAGVIKILCDHAHSADSHIRLVSLWALKHLVNGASNEVKVSCFEELGTGWLVQIVTGGSGAGAGSNGTKPAKPSPSQGPVSSNMSLGAANAAGERVDILNAADEPMSDLSESAILDATDDPMETMADAPDIGFSSSANLPLPSQDPALAAIAAKHRARLCEIKEAEAAVAVAAPQRNELQIQVQGLDFIRNLILGPRAGEMIDCLFNTLGSARVFDIVLGKIKAPLPTPPAPSSSTPSRASPAPPTTPATATTPLPPALIHSALFILNHIAGGTPLHRALLISQPTLLRAVLPHFSHASPGIRVVCVWIVISLTWPDDETDHAGARQRAYELRGLGFEERLRQLLNDEVMDVRERVGTALSQMGDLMADGRR